LKIEKMADEAEAITESTEAPVKRGRGRPKGTTKSGLPYVPKPKSELGRGRPKGTSNFKTFFLFMPPKIIQLFVLVQEDLKAAKWY
jgi:hypothetical protein